MVLRFSPLPFFDRIRLGILALRARRVENWRELEGVTASDWLRQMGGDKVCAPEQVVVVFDHHYPPIRQQDSVSQKRTREWIKEQGITIYGATGYCYGGMSHTPSCAATV